MELAILRICERNGWTQAFFESLPDKEKDDRLAFDYKRQATIDSMLSIFYQKIDEKKPIDMPAYIMLLLAELL